MLIGFKGKQKQGRVRFPGFGRSFSVEAFCQSEISGHLISDSKQLSARIIRSLENLNGSLTSIVQKRTVHSPLAFPLGLGNILSLGLLSRFPRLIPSIWQIPRKFLCERPCRLHTKIDLEVGFVHNFRIWTRIPPAEQG